MTAHARQAPAKINLSLRITGRRADGYHLIDSLFVPVAFADRITVCLSPASATTVHCHCPQMPELDGDENLAARAVRAFLDAACVRAEVEVVIEKQIWTAAGLGGGSADAAATLLLLQEHAADNLALPSATLSPPALARLAADLGADVPFFLVGRPMRAQGIGTELSALRGMPTLHLVLLNPGRPLSTRDVYLGLNLLPGCVLTPPVQPDDLEGDLTRVLAQVANDLEPPAIRLCPEIAEMKRVLAENGVLAAGMTGSGATVFGICASAAAATELAAKLSRTTDFLACATHTLP